MFYLKFFVDKGGMTQLIMSPALLNPAGLYEDSFFVYTEDGKFSKKDIKGEVEVEWIEKSPENV